MNKKYILVQRIERNWDIFRRFEAREEAIKWLKWCRKNLSGEFRIVKELY